MAAQPLTIDAPLTVCAQLEVVLEDHGDVTGPRVVAGPEASEQ